MMASTKLSPHLDRGTTTASKFGPASHVVYHQRSWEPEKITRLRELVRPPIIRQASLADTGKIYREPSPREVPRFELFFDLLFVAIIHQLADAAIEEPSGDAVARFVLTFWPSWSIWEEARKYSNVSGTDDLLHRLWVLVGMACLLGYSANASAIELHPAEEEGELDHTAVRAATAFWLIIKLTRVLVHLVYAWRLPLFRTSSIMSALAVFTPMVIYLPLIWVADRHTQVILASIAIVVDICRIDLICYNIRGRLHARRVALQRESRVELGWHKMPDMPDGLRLPAMNIEHAIERSSAFVVIVLGELVMNLLYNAGAGDLGASLKYGRAVLGLMVAWALNYLYLLPNEPNNEYEHALRRSYASGVTFTFLHWPLCASLVLASAASGRMVTTDEVEPGVHWYWGCGLGFAVLAMALIDISHRALLPQTDVRIPRSIRFILSILAALALILFPLGANHLSSIAMMAIAVAITWVLVVVGVVGILPKPGAIRAGEKDTTEGPEAQEEKVEEGEAAMVVSNGATTGT